MWTNCLRPYRRPGVTLVEVVAGLLLLAALASATLVAFGRHQQQIRHAALKIEATQVAEELLVRWYSGTREIPREARGVMTGDRAGWIWTTRQVRPGQLGPVRLAVVRLEIYRRSDASARVAVTEPLAAVELLVSTPPPARRPTATPETPTAPQRPPLLFR